MTAITTYLYQQKIDVITVNPVVRNTMTMFYTPNIKVYRGIDNTFRVQFKNRDQKPVSITDKTVSFILIDKETGTSYLERTVENVNAPQGIGKVTISETDLLNFDAKFYTYSFKVVNGEGETQVGYADDNYGAAGVLEVADGVYPTFVASTNEDFDTGNTGSVIYIDPYINRNTAQHTAQVFFGSAFTGTLTVEASLSPAVQGLNNDDFVTLNAYSYTGQETPVMINWNGIYSAVRFTRSTTTGTLSNVLYRP